MKTTLTKNSPLDILNTQLSEIFIALMPKAMREDGMKVNISNEISNSMVDTIIAKAVVGSDIVIANELAADVLCILNEQYPNGIESWQSLLARYPEKINEFGSHLEKICT